MWEVALQILLWVLINLVKRSRFIGAVSDDQFGDFIINFFNDRGIDTTQIVRAKNGEKLGLTFTEIKVQQKAVFLMWQKYGY